MTTTEILFRDLALPEPILRALTELGYEQPTPIQASAIPPLLAAPSSAGASCAKTAPCQPISIVLDRQVARKALCVTLSLPSLGPVLCRTFVLREAMAAARRAIDEASGGAMGG